MCSVGESKTKKSLKSGHSGPRSRLEWGSSRMSLRSVTVWSDFFQFHLKGNIKQIYKVIGLSSSTETDGQRNGLKKSATVVPEALKTI